MFWTVLGFSIEAPVKLFCDYFRLLPEGKVIVLRDFGDLPKEDPGIERALLEGIAWLCVSQDNSTPKDGGSARHFSLFSGWSSSYPETTGYIIPTMIEYAKRHGNETFRQRARVMLDWLVSI